MNVGTQTNKKCNECLCSVLLINHTSLISVILLFFQDVFEIQHTSNVLVYVFSTRWQQWLIFPMCLAAVNLSLQLGIFSVKFAWLSNVFTSWTWNLGMLGSCIRFWVDQVILATKCCVVKASKNGKIIPFVTHEWPTSSETHVKFSLVYIQVSVSDPHDKMILKGSV